MPRCMLSYMCHGRDWRRLVAAKQIAGTQTEPRKDTAMTALKVTARYTRYLVASLSTVAFGLGYN